MGVSSEALTGFRAQRRQQSCGLEDSYDASIVVYLLPTAEMTPAAALMEAACALAPATPAGLTACRAATAAAVGVAADPPGRSPLAAAAQVRQPVGIITPLPAPGLLTLQRVL